VEWEVPVPEYGAKNSTDRSEDGAKNTGHYPDRSSYQPKEDSNNSTSNPNPYRKGDDQQYNNQNSRCAHGIGVGNPFSKTVLKC
jgi:hypothetical protein